MNNRYRRQRRRITGRFYAFVTIMVVLCVMLGVFINTRNSRSASTDFVPPTPTDNMVQNSQAPVVDNTPIQQDLAAANQEGTTSDVNSKSIDIDDVEGADGTGEEASEAEAPAQQIVNAQSIADELELSQPLPEDQIQKVTDLSVRTDLPGGWRNILLLGSDSRDMDQISRTRCDTIMIASINTETGLIKLTSLMRDMMIEIPNRGFEKITSATYYGGPKLLMKLINEKLGMNITEYAVVNFAGLANVIDVLGGIYVNVTEKEKEQINEHIGEIAMYTMTKDEYRTKKAELMLQTHGTEKKLNGIQAVSYARIRNIDNDYQRTQRQRMVLNGIMERVKGANAIQLMQIAGKVWDFVDTNVSMTSAVGLAASVFTKERGGDIKEWRMPGKDTYVDVTRGGVSAIYDIDYPENAILLHYFIYGEKFP